MNLKKCQLISAFLPSLLFFASGAMAADCYPLKLENWSADCYLQSERGSEQGQFFSNLHSLHGTSSSAGLLFKGGDEAVKEDEKGTYSLLRPELRPYAESSRS